MKSRVIIKIIGLIVISAIIAINFSACDNSPTDGEKTELPSDNSTTGNETTEPDIEKMVKQAVK